MIDVNGGQRQLPGGPASMQQIEQYDGIHAAAERYGNVHSAYGMRVQRTINDRCQFLVHDGWATNRRYSLLCAHLEKFAGTRDVFSEPLLP
jgi:hypothetical protein